MAMTAGAAAGAALPEVVAKWVGQTALADSQTMYFLTAIREATCAAACARIVPTGSDAVADPGATQAEAVVFIDRFLAAFDELKAAASDGPPIWLSGPFSNRNPFPDNRTGTTGHRYPAADSMLSTSGQMQSLLSASITPPEITPAQAAIWKAQLHGYSSLSGNGKWVSQVNGSYKDSSGSSVSIPGVPAQGLRTIYNEGLDALNAWSHQVTGQPFAAASTTEQDLMLAAAGNVVLAAILPQVPLSSLPVDPAPPAAAQNLFPYLVTHTFQACYGLPEYRQLDSNPLWQMIGYDGDTVPLGNSIYGSEVPGDNDGFGVDPTTGEPLPGISGGGYNEYRPVSYITDGDASALTPAQATQIVKFLKRAR